MVITVAGNAGAASGLPPLTAADALISWHFAPVVSAVLILLAVAYLGGVLVVGRRHPVRPWPVGRSAAFMLGLATVAVATQSSIGVYDDVLFSVHMMQHLLLIMVAPPLLILGRPVTLLLHAARNPVHARVKRILRSPVVSGLTCPPVAASLYAAVVVSTHLTPLMNLVLENEAVHDAEHALYLVAGYLYFLPIVGSEPIRWRLSELGRYLMLLITMPVDTLVGVTLTLIPRELFRAYARTGRTWGPGLVTDLHQGGLIMFAGSDLIMTVLAVILAASFIRASGRSPSARPVGLDRYNTMLAALGGSYREAAIPASAAAAALPHQRGRRHHDDPGRSSPQAEPPAPGGTSGSRGPSGGLPGR
jgi:putative copper resistance protein D